VRVYTNPVALFATNDTAQCVDVHRFNFTNQSTSSRSLTYAWDFGDTSNATGTNAFKVYTSYGRRTVSLVARDNLGCADTMLESIYVAPYPISNFTINDSVQCENHNLYIYEDASTILAGGGSLNSAWVYGDGDGHWRFSSA
jgi:PKD domain.